jgi:hypothetical protein
VQEFAFQQKRLVVSPWLPRDPQHDFKSPSFLGHIPHQQKDKQCACPGSGRHQALAAINRFNRLVGGGSTIAPALRNP